MQANLYTNFAINQENKMKIIKLKLDSNLVVSCLKNPFRRIRLRSFPLFLMIVKELQYLLLDKGVYARNYSNGAFCKPRGIWWLGRNRFIYGILFCFGNLFGIPTEEDCLNERSLSTLLLKQINNNTKSK